MLWVDFLSVQVQTKAKWEPIPMISRELRSKGVKGGEGAQWPRALDISSDGTVAFLGIDVGGIYRSLDGGKTWSSCNVGFWPRGACGLAIDPNDKNRVVAIGANSSPGDHHGIYLSTNCGASWKLVKPIRMGGLGEIRDQVAFSKTGSVVWSRIKEDIPNWGDAIRSSEIYLSSDKGSTWSKSEELSPFAGGFVRFFDNGELAIGSSDGIRIVNLSQPSRVLFENKSLGRITGLSIGSKQVWVSNSRQIQSFNYEFDKGHVRLNSTPSGITRPVPDSHEIRNVKVHPKDPSSVIFWAESVPNTWDWPRYYSHDGGKTWTKSFINHQKAFLPGNTRQGIFAFDPLNSKKIFSIGGDWPTISNDGGKTYHWSANGNNAVLIGGSFQFCANDPDLMFYGSQDYNASVSFDGGKYWSYLNPSGNGWGGFCYGGYALDQNTLWVGSASGWGAPRSLKISSDGGKFWRDSGLKFQGLDISNGVPGSQLIGFASDLRTTDGGRTWVRMTGCDGVTHSTKSALIGLKKKGSNRTAIVRSRDAGATWAELVVLDRDATDACEVNGQIYIAAMNLYRFENGVLEEVITPLDQFKNRTVRTVTADPTDSKTLYIGNNANLYNASNSVCRSTDNGRTWTVLTRNKPLAAGELDGGRETFWIRVHPITREAWCATSCYGIWKVK
jgi:photosystem II stability/assembly factor-like uncharacterized protein